MRGEDRADGALFSYVDIEARIPAKHPLRAMRRLTNAALADLYGGRASVQPTGVIAAGHAVAASLYDPLGATIGRTD
jgi:hypothetical protein